MITETRATRMLAQFLPDAAPRELLWSSAFRLGQGQSRAYRSGRWLLVGDAAHSMGPSAGAGMMIGILGAWRLGLRLAEAIAGGTDEPLNRYEVEQRSAAEQVQRDNARIFANIALRSAPLAAIRAAGLGTVGRLPRLSGRMAASEALLHLPRVMDDRSGRGNHRVSTRDVEP